MPALVLIIFAGVFVLIEFIRGRRQKLVYAMLPAGKWKAGSVTSLEKVYKPCPCCLASADSIVPVELTSVRYWPGSKTLGSTMTISALKCQKCNSLLKEVPASFSGDHVVLS